MSALQRFNWHISTVYSIEWHKNFRMILLHFLFFNTLPLPWIICFFFLLRAPIEFLYCIPLCLPPSTFRWVSCLLRLSFLYKLSIIIIPWLKISFLAPMVELRTDYIQSKHMNLFSEKTTIS